MAIMKNTVQIASTLLAIGSVNAAATPKADDGKLPTLGWNSWNMYHCDITEEKFLSAAEKMKSTGLQAAGYNYVNIDDCWSEKTGRVDGHIAVNKTRFPDGIDGLATKIHAMDFKFGIYSTAGDLTCAGYPASLGYEDVDAADFAKWGIDFLKYDNCNVPQDWQDQYVYCNSDHVKTGPNGTCTQALDPNLAPPGYDWSKSKSAERFNRMRDALVKQSRKILYNLCIWGTADVFAWGKETAISWRMSGDISPNWGSVMNILNINSFHMNTVDFYSHNDADMLEVGNGDLTTAETRSHFALWAAMKSPLLIGTDISVLSQANIDILKNKYLLAFNQDDKFGKPAAPYKWGINPDWTFNKTHPAEFWAGESQKGHLVLMVNTLDQKTTKTAVWSEVPGLKGKKHKVTDVWTGKSLGCLSEYKVDVESHDTAAILVGAECKC